jgi:hypothetical protein
MRTSRADLLPLHEDAITADAANENELAFDATGGDWHMSLP